MTEQLSGMDAAFLSMETPETPMHVVGVLLLDPAGGKDFSVRGLHQVIADRIHLMPPFCRRLIEAPLSLDKPYWHYDTDIDLDQHVFDLRLAEGSDLHALGELVGGIAERRLPRDRPCSHPRGAVDAFPEEVGVAGVPGVLGDQVAVDPAQQLE